MASQEDTNHRLFCLHVETPQPKLQHEQFGEQLPAGNARKATISLLLWWSGFSNTSCSNQNNRAPKLYPVFPPV
jgi:hypothetical protein